MGKPIHSLCLSVSTSVKEPALTNLDSLCPVGSEDVSSQGSSDSQRDIQESFVRDVNLSDEKVTQIESILDLWSGSLKVFCANYTIFL